MPPRRQRRTLVFAPQMTEAIELKASTALLANHLGPELCATTLIQSVPDVGYMPGGTQNRFAQPKATTAGKRRTVTVSRDVLDSLVAVADELNRAQAEMEYRKTLKQRCVCDAWGVVACMEHQQAGEHGKRTAQQAGDTGTVL